MSVCACACVLLIGGGPMGTKLGTLMQLDSGMVLVKSRSIRENNRRLLTMGQTP